MIGDRRRVVVVGGGASAAAALGELRRLRFAGQVTVIAGEPTAPYNRTTVNKGLLSGEVDLDSVLLPADAPEATQWLLGRRAEGLDLAERTVAVHRHGRVPFDGVILATGGTPRVLPAHWEPHVHRITTASDALNLRAALSGGKKDVTIVGGGLIGSEAASILTAAGHHVALVDANKEPLRRHLGDTVARWANERHAAVGVRLLLGKRVSDVGTARGRRRQLGLDDGTLQTADVVVAALGHGSAVPWLAESGLLVADGIVTDAELRAITPGRPSDPDAAIAAVTVAGDLARVPHPVFAGTLLRSGHWGNALSQGAHAARTVLRDLGSASSSDGPVHFDELPSYSTYIHGTKVHIVGLPHLGTHAKMLRHQTPDGRFAVAHLDAGGTVVGAVAVAGAKPLTAIRPVIAARGSLADIAIA